MDRMTWPTRGEFAFKIEEELPGWSPGDILFALAQDTVKSQQAEVRSSYLPLLYR